jgi:hypothetical protein
MVGVPIAVWTRDFPLQAQSASYLRQAGRCFFPGVKVTTIHPVVLGLKISWRCTSITATRIRGRDSVHTYIYNYLPTYIYTYTYTHIHTHTHTYTYIHTHTHTHIHTYTYTRTYTYIHNISSLLSIHILITVLNPTQYTQIQILHITVNP